MLTVDQLDAYRAVQRIAKNVLHQLSDTIHNGSTEATIAQTAIQLLEQAGVTQTWYHDTPALVLLGSRSVLSVSGKDYQPAREPVGQHNVITVDVSPQMNAYWGDCARTYIVENGQVTSSPTSTACQQGLAIEQGLHQEMKSMVKPDTRFCDLFHFGNARIAQHGYENLDFLSNLGHSIETQRADRRFIDAHCTTALGDVALFTFEPHIKHRRGNWGFKHENIYYFDEHGTVQEL